MRNLKILGIALIAVAALSAMAASAASAQVELTASAYPATLTGEQTAGAVNQLSIGAASVSCKVGKYHGTITGPTTTPSVSLDYTECSTSFGTGMTFDNNGCSYQFHLEKAATTGTDKYSAEATLKCPEGKNLTITMGLCTIHVPEQGKVPVTITHLADNPGDIELDVDYSGVELSVTNVFACPISTSATTGRLQTEVTVTAETDPGNQPLDLTVSE